METTGNPTTYGSPGGLLHRLQLSSVPAEAPATYRRMGGGGAFRRVTSHGGLPVVSIVVPSCGLTSFVLRIPKGNPKKGTTMETVGKLLPGPGRSSASWHR